MTVTLEQLGLEERQEEAVRLRLRHLSLDEIGLRLGIRKSAVSQLLARAQAKAAAQSVTLFSRRRTIRPNSPFRR